MPTRTEASFGPRDPGRAAIPIAIALFGAAIAVTLGGSLKVQHDSGVYLALAKSLAGGHGYRDLYLAGAPLDIKYPPVFPVLLSPLVGAFGFAVVPLKVVVGAMAVAALCALARLGRELGPAPLPLLVVLFTAASPGIVFYATSITTEIPYLLFSLLALSWLHRYVLGTARAIWLVFLLPLAYLTRLIGLSLLLAGVAYLLVEPCARRGKRLGGVLLAGVAAALPAVSWFLLGAWMRGEAAEVTLPYIEQFRLALRPASGGTDALQLLLARAVTNLLHYAVHVGRIVCFPATDAVGPALSAMLAAVTAVGFWDRVVRKRTVIEYYVLCYASVLLVYPATHRQRYLVPLIPFVWYYFLTGGRRLGAMLGVTSRRLAASALLALFVVNATDTISRNVLRTSVEGYYAPAGVRDYQAVIPWVVAQTSTEAVFLWAMPSLRYVWSGRAAAPIRLPRSPDRLLASIRAHAPDYVVVDDLPGPVARSIRDLVEAHPERFRLVHRVPASDVYEVLR